MSESELKLYDRYINELNLNSEISNILARDAKLSSFYEESLNILNSPVSLANIVANEVARELKQNEVIKFTPNQIAGLVKMIDEETISSKIAKQVFEQMVQNGENPEDIVQAKGLVQISDPSVIEPLIDEVIAKNQDNVAKYKAGNKNLFGFFVGAVLKATAGKANPKIVNELVAKKLENA
jgi:glutaminyl-tRNA synthetase